MARSDPTLLLSALALASVLLIGTSEAGECRQGRASATKHCALPIELGNFQGYYLCNEDVRIGRPIDKAALLDLVAHYDKVKGVGVGHSWWGQQFCSGNSSNSINIVTTELQTTLNLILDPIYYNGTHPAPPDYPIRIDEQKRTVTAASGVPQRILLDSLARYKSEAAPNGYAIAAFPWYIDQSIGGAVSTGRLLCLASTLKAQTVRLELALADGSLANFSQNADPFLWKAAQIAVGRLGVITEVELSILPQDMVERLTFETSFADFVDAMMDLQEDYTEAVNGTSSRTVAEVLSDYEGTQLFWFAPTNTTSWLKYAGLEAEAAKEMQNENEPKVQTDSIEEVAPLPAEVFSLTDSKAPALAPGPYLKYAFSQAPSPALGKFLQPATDPVSWNALQNAFLKTWLTNGTFTRRDSILAETEFVNRATSDTDPYDQYEFSVRIEHVGDCMERVETAMREEDLYLGFPVPPLIRFVGEEEAFLSNANGGPRMFLNIEDHQSYQTGEPNLRFDALVGVLRGEGCWARMHWGKAGWAKWAPCFDGSEEYPDTWCEFGCAVKALDPGSKFASQSNVWSWRAESGGKEVPFESCCSARGFSNDCSCARRTDCLPAAP